eukprot:TRINITY_DN13474_c0_g1_i1.p1 TRINITY_DN13474_c0_g1~~TRINITY_DN13474_c0_g1_i1.p1  ORF type:complete len:121 (+),score=17.24 TRINITY_DN13474_c0_g1_i1:30-365(+)
MAGVSQIEVFTYGESDLTRVTGYKGLIIVSKCKSRNMFSDIGSGFKSLVGGEIKGLSKLTRDIREELLEELKEKAVEMGADTVLGLRMETNSVFDGVLEMVMYGTAVQTKS